MKKKKENSQSLSRTIPKKMEMGFGLLETMVALVIAAIGLIALTQMSIGGLRSSTASANQMLANDAAILLIERMRANSSQAAINGSYNAPATYVCPTNSPNNCGDASASCTIDQIAAYDLFEAICQNQILTLLPDSRMTTNCAANATAVNPQAICQVSIQWRSLTNNGSQTHTIQGLVL